MTAETFEELAARFDEARLVGYTFENKQLRFQLFRDGSGRLYSFTVATDTVHGRTVPAAPDRAACSIRLVDLTRRLDIRHDRYFPPDDPRLLLNDARERVTLAYGRRSDDHRWLVNLQGEYPLLSFLVRDLSEIRWQVD